MKNKNILEELTKFLLTIPDGPIKVQVSVLILKMHRGTITLKEVLVFIAKRIESEKSVNNKNVTMRENNIRIWEYILNLFTNQLKGV